VARLLPRLSQRGVCATLLDQEVECAGRRATRLRRYRVWLTDDAGRTLAEKPAPTTWIPINRRDSFGESSGGAICRRFRPSV
jgi:hypothetical protein